MKQCIFMICSQLIKGLVFKKHAALKNMITMHKRPRLLLVKGMLQSSASSGLASFNSMVKPIDPAKQPNGPNPSVCIILMQSFILILVIPCADFFLPVCCTGSR